MDPQAITKLLHSYSSIFVSSVGVICLPAAAVTHKTLLHLVQTVSKLALLLLFAIECPKIESRNEPDQHLTQMPRRLVVDELLRVGQLDVHIAVDALPALVSSPSAPLNQLHSGIDLNVPQACPCTPSDPI